jgi:biotin operon repressor
MIVIGRNEEGQLTAAQQLTRQQRSQKEVTDALGNLATALDALKRSGVEISKEVRTLGEWRIVVERVANNECGTH